MAGRSAWLRTKFPPAISPIFPLPLRLRPRKGEHMRALTFAAFALFGLLMATALMQAAEQQTLAIATKTGVHPFSVEMAVNDAERAKGLMYRKSLPEGQGMLFDFQSEQETSFWMENTTISLDIIFIRGDGRILRIAENTEPLSRRLIPSGGPVR